MIDYLARAPVGFSLFLLALIHRPGAAFLALKARCEGKRVRAMNILKRATSELPSIYQIWLRKIEPIRSKQCLAPNQNHRRSFRICIMVDGACSDDELDQSLASALVQTAPEDAVILVIDHSAGRFRSLAIETVLATDFDGFVATTRDAAPSAILVPLRCRDRLSATALASYRTAFSRNRKPFLCYGDEDEIDARHNRDRPWFKPAWNFEQFLGQDYVSGGCAIPFSSIASIGSLPAADICSAMIYTAVLSQTTASIVHIPHILCHRIAGGTGRSTSNVDDVIARHLPFVAIGMGRDGIRRINWPLPDLLPRVTAIIPTRDRLDLLQQCIAGLRRCTYKNLEILIIDNDSARPETLAYLNAAQQSDVRVMRYSGAFNFAAMNNLAAHNADSPLLCFINNDIDFHETDWLEAMVRQAVRREVGAVGAKLLYPDRTIQHVGVAIGLGGAAGHIHKHLPDSSDAHHSEPHVQREVSAVTAACMLVAKNKFTEVGGFNEELFAVAFNDVDFCLKLHAAGYLNIYTPYAVAVHHESQSRGDDLDRDNVDRYRLELTALQDRWHTATALDPNWNVNLDYGCEQMSIKL